MTAGCPVCGGGNPLTSPELPTCRCGSTWATRPRKPLQRRTPLAPGTKGLAPGKGLTRSAPAPARTTPIARTAPAPKPRKPRVAATVRTAVRVRSGERCEVGILAVCRARGRSLVTADGANQHHRRPGGMGGTKRAASHDAANLLQVCGRGNTSGCHGWIEQHRELARGMGLLLWQDQDPETTPVRLWDGRKVLLTAAGYVPVGESDADQVTA